MKLDSNNHLCLYHKTINPFLFRNIVVANNLHLPFLCPLKVTKQSVINKRLIKIERKINKIEIDINNKNLDIRGNNILGNLFGYLQRRYGVIHEERNFKGFNLAWRVG